MSVNSIMAKLVLFGFVATVLPISADGSQFPPVCSALPNDLETKVYFGNGIRSSYEDAKDASEILSSAYGSTFENLRNDYDNYKDELFSFDVAYNNTAGRLANRI